MLIYNGNPRYAQHYGLNSAKYFSSMLEVQPMLVSTVS